MNARNALLIGSLALGAVGNARAQCTVTIPASATSITTDSVFSLVAQAVWVCNNAVVDGSSVDPVFFLEPGTSMVFSGLSKNIYAKAGSTVDGSGIDDTIHYELGTNLLIGGLNQTLILCDPLVFDYSLVGGQGCSPSTSVSESKDERITVQPSIATDRVAVRFGQGFIGRSVALRDGAGRLIRLLRASTAMLEVDVSALDAGVYTVVLEPGRIAGRFIKD